MEKGWVKLYRKVLNHPIFKSRDDKLFKTFIYCLLRANYEDTTVFFNRQMVSLKPGQFITGRNEAAADLGYGSKTFDRKINDLLNLQFLTRHATRRYSLISIINWESYQAKQGEEDLPSDPEYDPLTGTKVTTEKNIKNRRRKDICSRENAEKNPFEAFYYVYPKKKARKDAEKAWNKLSPDIHLFQRIITALEKQKQSQEWQREKGKFIPHPATWLNGHRWEDDLQEGGATW